MSPEEATMLFLLFCGGSYLAMVIGGSIWDWWKHRDS